MNFETKNTATPATVLQSNQYWAGLSFIVAGSRQPTFLAGY